MASYITYFDPLKEFQENIRAGGKQIIDALDKRRKRKRVQTLLAGLSPDKQALLGGLESPEDVTSSLISLRGQDITAGNASENRKIREKQFSLEEKKYELEREEKEFDRELLNKTFGLKERGAELAEKKFTFEKETTGKELGFKEQELGFKKQQVGNQGAIVDIRRGELERKKEKDKEESELIKTFTSGAKNKSDVDSATLNIFIKQQKALIDRLKK